MKKVYVLLLLNFIFFASCSRSVKSSFEVVSSSKEDNNIKVVVEAKKSGRQSENIFLITQFLDNNDVIVNTSMSQIGPMMFDAGKYEFSVPVPTNSFAKYTNMIDEIAPEKAEKVVYRTGYGNSFFSYWMLMEMMDSRRPVYYDTYGDRRTIDRDYYDDRHTTARRSGGGLFNRNSSKKTTSGNSSTGLGGLFNGSSSKKTTVNDNNSTSKRRTLFKSGSGSSTRKKSTFRRSSTRRSSTRRR